jgi:hypothetical protein
LKKRHGTDFKVFVVLLWLSSQVEAKRDQVVLVVVAHVPPKVAGVTQHASEAPNL